MSSRRHVAEASARALAQVAPPRWEAVQLGTVAELQPGYAFDSEWFSASGIRLLRGTNIVPGGTRWDDVVHLPLNRVDKFPQFALRAGDIVIAMDRPFISTGLKVARLLPTDCPALLLQRVGRFQPSSAISPEYLHYYLQGSTFSAHTGGLATGTQLPHISKTDIETCPLLLPPLNEQRRIVAKLDAIFEQTRAAKARLERLPALLDKLKRSILAAAFRGDLTANWRAAHPNVIAAPARQFESTKGRLWGSGADAERPTRELPSRWRWAQLRELGQDAVQIGPMSMKSAEFTDVGTTVLNVGCVQWGRLDLSKCDHLPPARAADFERYRVRAGDVLFTRSGSVGRSALATDEVDGALMTFHLLRVRASPDICRSRFLYLALRGVPEVRSAIEEVAVGATRAGFNTRLLESLWIPLPPLEEQEQIEHQAESALSRLSEVEGRIVAVGARVSKLENAALAKAFRGELTEQDPNDEPASAVVERLRAERESAPARPRTRGPQKKVPSSTPLRPKRLEASRARMTDSQDLEE